MLQLSATLLLASPQVISMYKPSLTPRPTFCVHSICTRIYLSTCLFSYLSISTCLSIYLSLQYTNQLLHYSTPCRSSRVTWGALFVSLTYPSVRHHIIFNCHVRVTDVSPVVEGADRCTCQMAHRVEDCVHYIKRTSCQQI
jgi:hypothetical protein